MVAVGSGVVVGSGVLVGAGVFVGPGVPAGAGVGGGIDWPLPPSIISDETSTASKLAPNTSSSSASDASSQAGSGAPLRPQAGPGSARNMPYFWRAVRITRARGENAAGLTVERSRKRVPAGGSAGSSPSAPP